MANNSVNRGVFRFQDLNFDIQSYILALLSPSELLPLTLVSHFINSLSTEALYADIHLIFTSKARPDGTHAYDEAPLEQLKSSQHAFTKHLLTRPKFTRHVRRVTWQVCGSTNTTFTNLFPLLDNVTHIHLVDPHPTYLSQRASFLRPYYSISIPSMTMLFPRVHSIKFTGTTSLSLVMPILHSPQHITSLSLDTITPQNVALALLHWLRIAPLNNLRTLSLRTLVDESGTATSCGQAVVFERDQELPLAWREALSALRHSLESVTLGLRERAKVNVNVKIKKDASLELAQMIQIVFPVFWEESWLREESWPRLRVLRLEGGIFNGGGLSRSVARLRAVVPTVVVDPEVQPVQRVWYSQTIDKF